MDLNLLLPLIRKNHTSSGFTLLELLLGSVLTSFVMGVAGWSLVQILTLDQKASAKGNIQYNSNRALEFISEEVKQARKIESNAVASLVEAPDFPLPDGAEPIVVLDISSLPQPVVYSTKPAENLWEGPHVIERWGPRINENGVYDPTQVNNPENWESYVLIDSIDDALETPSCSTGWQETNSNATRGFNACVDPNEKLVQLNLATTTDNKTWREEVNYEVETVAFARSSEPIIIFEGKKLILPKASTVKFEILGGDVVCSSGGPEISVETSLFIDENEQTWDTDSPLILTDQPAGTTFDVKSVSDGRPNCDLGMTVSTTDKDSPQVRVLVDGDEVPDITPFANQNTIDYFLRDYIENGKVKLADNEAIYLFELAVTNEQSSAFDLQDNVVLATVDPSN
ncbi:hypothetical protein [Crocosphaera sp. Alani8]|uniref:hypothetical protein n=1 Tax=Crocosphaera sp. Alani8 TaxID=3038952 RepID=UPI00313A922D